MVSAPIASPDLYPAAYYNLGKTIQDMLTAYAKAKAATGATVGTEIEAAVVAAVPDLVSALGQITDMSADFTAQPIGCIMAIVVPIVDGVKAITGIQ